MREGLEGAGLMLGEIGVGSSSWEKSSTGGWVAGVVEDFAREARRGRRRFRGRDSVR